MRTLGDLVCPHAVRRDAALRDGVLVLAGSLLVAACARIQIPLVPVPLTMQPFAVLLVGAVLGSRRGGLALVAYLLEGAAGLPVFALPAAGLAYLVGPTGGYLLAFPIAACVVGRLAEHGRDRRLRTAIPAMAAGLAIIQVLGFLWLTAFVGPREAFTIGVASVPGDAVKVLLAAAALPAGWRFVRRIEQPRDDRSS